MNSQTIAEKIEALKAEMETSGATVKIDVSVLPPEPDIAALEEENQLLVSRLDEISETLTDLGLEKLLDGSYSLHWYRKVKEMLKCL